MASDAAGFPDGACSASAMLICIGGLVLIGPQVKPRYS